MLTYEEMGKLPADRSVIPATCTSFSEAAMYVAEASTSYVNKFFEEIGISELAIFESTGSVVVYEGSKLEAFKEGLAKVWDKIWTAIKSLFQKIFDFFKKKADERVFKLTRISANDIDKIEDDKFGENSVLGRFKFVKYSYGKDMVDIASYDPDSATAKLFTASVELETGRENAKNFLDSVYKDVSGCSEAKDMESMKNALRDKLAKEEKEEKLTKAFLKSEIGNIGFAVRNCQENLKKRYREAKAEVDKAKRALKGIKDDQMSLIQMKTRCEQTAIMAKYNALMVCFDVQKKEFQQGLHLFRILHHILGKKATNESVNFVEEAFEW